MSLLFGFFGQNRNNDIRSDNDLIFFFNIVGIIFVLPANFTRLKDVVLKYYVLQACKFFLK